ncbi:MAG TPA: thymidine phosphorylase [Patescibacteria group bacterium]|nr:thymidine phosphorylase [Patescibacteria group bacterium]
MEEKEIALEAVRKKLLGKKLTYKEIFAVMDEISHSRFGEVLTTYFAASGYSQGFTNEELFFLTRAMVETGEKLYFRGIVADKHSIGGVPGTRTTLIVIPIIAAAGFTIPKSSSRAITTPDGTADDMEVLSRVEFTRDEIYKIVKQTSGCIVWGGSFRIAPADDILIHVEKPLMFESYDKIIVSIMAKKVAFGSNHVVIDLPYGKNMKVHKKEDADILKDKFEYVAKKFEIKIKVFMHPTDEPAGRGIGPVLETQEALRVLEQTSDRPLDLEERALRLATALLDLCLSDAATTFRNNKLKQYGACRKWAEDILQSGKALAKMKAIIKAQKGNPLTTSTSLSLQLGRHSEHILAKNRCKIKGINSKNITIIAKLLGAPAQKGAGIFLHQKIGDSAEAHETLFTMYSETLYNLKEAKDSLRHFPIMEL